MTETELVRAQRELIEAQQRYIAMLMGMERANLVETGRFAAQTQGAAPLRESLTFRECAEYYMNVRKTSMRESSFADCLRTLNKIILPEIGDARSEDLNSKRMQEFADGLLSKYSDHSARDYTALVKTVLNCCAADDLIDENKFRVRWPKRTKPEYRPLTEQEHETIWKAASESKKPNHLAVCVALETGMRIGEICGLLWEDVDLDAKRLQVKRTVQRIYDSEKQTTRLNVGCTKTPAGTRTIPISDRLIEALSANRRENDIYVASGRETPTEPRTLRQAYIRMLKNEGIRHIRFHDLRHSFATRSIQAGIDPKTLAKILGHENCSLTLDIYTSVTEEMMDKAIKKLNRDLREERE